MPKIKPVFGKDFWKKSRYGLKVVFSWDEVVAFIRRLYGKKED